MDVNKGLVGGLLVAVIALSSVSLYENGQLASERLAKPTTTTRTETTRVTATTTSTVFPVDCEGLREVQDSNVIYMNLTSTACVLLTYKVNYHAGTYQGSYYPPGGILDLGLTISKVPCYHYSNGTLGCSSGKNYSGSFIVAFAPSFVNLTQIPVDSTFNVLFLVHPLDNATGYYDTSFPKPPCLTYAFAVGYSSDQVNGSNFSSYNSFVHSCFVLPYTVVSLMATNMGFKRVAFPPP